MKCSALEFYVISLSGICNGKSRVKATRLFQSVAAALLQGFLSIRQNTCDDIEQYSKQLICSSYASNCSTLGGQKPPDNTPESPV